MKPIQSFRILGNRTKNHIPSCLTYNRKNINVKKAWSTTTHHFLFHRNLKAHILLLSFSHVPIHLAKLYYVEETFQKVIANGFAPDFTINVLRFFLYFIENNWLLRTLLFEVFRFWYKSFSRNKNTVTS